MAIKYTADFLAATRGRLNKSPRDFQKDYTFEIDGDMGMPPLLDVVRYLTEMAEKDGLSVESKERILRHAILGKRVTLTYRGKELGAFTMNAMNDPLEAFDPLRNNPAAVMLLMEITSNRMVEKSLPPQDSDPPMAAGTKGSPQSSSAKPGGG